MLHIKGCNVFLENWPLYHYLTPLFIPDKFPCSLMPALSEIDIAIPSIFLLVLACNIYIYLFIFNQSVFSYLKWDFVEDI